MADKKRRDEAEEEAQDSEAEAEDKAEDEAERASEDEAEEKADGEDEGQGEEDEGEADEAAKRVAKALGVDDGEEGEAAEAEKTAEEKAAEAPTNRAARRREEALARRKKRKGAAAAKTDDDEAPLPKDKNARAKELLKRRREQASGSGARPIQLLPGEMVDDALARSTSAAGKWVRQNFNKLQWVILAGIVGLGGFLIYTSQTEKKAAAATNELLSGVSADLGRVMAEDKRTDEEKEADPAKVYKTVDERNEAALAGYRKAIAEQRDTKVGQLAKLGEAGALLDKRDYAGAIDAYNVVLGSKLATADIDVKGRATEGLGLAQEGKGDLDGALATFKELEGIDARGYKELGLFQQARILLAKGDKDKATELLKQVRDKLQTSGGDASAFIYLQTSVDEALRRIDPSLVPAKGAAMGGPKGNNVSADEMGKIRKLIDDAAKKKPQPEEH